MTEQRPQTTDFDEWCAFLARFGIGFTVETGDVGNTLRMKAGEDKVGGYRDFFVDVEFDAAGAFQKIGAWE